MAPELDWHERLRIINDLMRRVSAESSPQELVRLYGVGIRELMPIDRLVALSRRDLAPPWFRITRSTIWTESINPWTQKDRLPLLRDGFLGELLYAQEPRIIEDLRIPESDPAAEHLAGMTCLMTLPQYDNGVAVNMTVLGWRDKADLPREQYPNMVWQSNLFGRATHNLVLRRELSQAYEAINRELKVVGEIQRSLLPRAKAEIPGVDLCPFYEPSAQAGGDYYDLFELPGGNWGMFIADVAGHGTPAAVLMAVTHALARSFSGPPEHPCLFLDHINSKLVSYYTTNSGTFVTAFYGVYNPRTRELRYASAGHNPPRLRTRRGIEVLDKVGGLPLGIMPTQECSEATVVLEPGDMLCLYTDGITETQNAEGDQFDVPRLDELLRAEADEDLSAIAERISRAVNEFSGHAPAKDDRTMLLARVRAS